LGDEAGGYGAGYIFIAVDVCRKGEYDELEQLSGKE